MANVKIKRLGGGSSTLSVAGSEEAAEAHIKFDENGEAVITEDEWASLEPAADKLGVYKVGDSSSKTTTLHDLQAKANPGRFKKGK